VTEVRLSGVEPPSKNTIVVTFRVPDNWPGGVVALSFNLESDQMNASAPTPELSEEIMKTLSWDLP
jgi:hypothetical protein